MTHELPKLKYTYDALEPFIDAQTMEIHYTKHHQTYITNLNKALEPFPELQGIAIETLVKSIETLPDALKTVVRNNGGGHYNHTLFWNIMSPNAEKNPTGKVGDLLLKKWETYDKFKEEFTKAALTRFGSGWAWLVLNKDKQLEITSTANQDSPLLEGKYPLMGLDVWEHAYYLKYQNRRADYISAWFNVLDWKSVDYRFQEGSLL